MKIKEIMIREVKSIRPEDNAGEALTLLFEMQISGLPVIDSSGKLVGMFTEKEVLSYILPSYLEKVGKFVYEEDPKSIKNKFAQLGKMTVKEVMRREVVTTTENTALCEAARIMLTQKARRLPVLNAQCNLTGIVTRGDVLQAFAKEAK